MRIRYWCICCLSSTSGGWLARAALEQDWFYLASGLLALCGAAIVAWLGARDERLARDNAEILRGELRAAENVLREQFMKGVAASSGLKAEELKLKGETLRERQERFAAELRGSLEPGRGLFPAGGDATRVGRSPDDQLNRIIREEAEKGENRG